MRKSALNQNPIHAQQADRQACQLQSYLRSNGWAWLEASYMTAGPGCEGGNGIDLMYAWLPVDCELGNICYKGREVLTVRQILLNY